MKKLGPLVMAVGGLVGLAAGIWVAAGVGRSGLPWLVAVGLVKLTIAASLGLLAVGAMLMRIANQAARRSAVDLGEPESQQDRRIRGMDAERQGILTQHSEKDKPHPQS